MLEGVSGTSKEVSVPQMFASNQEDRIMDTLSENPLSFLDDEFSQEQQQWAID
jgi:hypothetical protein